MLDGLFIRGQMIASDILSHGLGLFMDTTSTTLDPDAIIQNGLASDTEGTFGKLNNKVSNVGGSTYKLLYMVMTFFFICGFILCMLKLFSSNTQNRSEVKNDIMWKIVAGICGFGVIAFVLLLSGIGNNLFN